MRKTNKKYINNDNYQVPRDNELRQHCKNNNINLLEIDLRNHKANPEKTLTEYVNDYFNELRLLIKYN